jgi:putative phage-type endonuclease
VTPEFEAQRRHLITGTDAPGIANVSPWATPLDVYMRKKHPELCAPLEERQQRSMIWGQRHEPAVAKAYADATGFQITKPHFVVHDKITWLAGSPDFLVKKRRRGLEVKTMNGFMRREWGPEGTDEVPMHVLLQVVHYMMLVDYEEWDVAALFDTSDFRIYHIVADADLQGMLLELEEDFYNRHLAGSEIPTYEADEKLCGYLARKYPTASNKVIQVDPYGDAELMRALRLLRDARMRKALSIKDETEQKAVIMTLMRDAGELHWDEEQCVIKYKNAVGKSKVDWQSVAGEALEALAPQARQIIMDKHTKTVPGARRFLPKFKGMDEEREDDE